MLLFLLTIISLTSIFIRVCGRLSLSEAGMGVLLSVMPLKATNRHSSIQYLKETRDLYARRAGRLF